MRASFLIAALFISLNALSAINEPKGWHLELMPYYWYAGLEGDAKLRGEKIDFEKSAHELFDATESGGSILTVLQYNRFLLWGQVDSFSLSTDELEVGNRPLGGKLETDLLIAEGAVGYQVDGWTAGQTFDLLVGVRSTHVENKLQQNDGQILKRENSIVDPMLFVRPSLPLFKSKTNRLRFNPVIGIGGGGDSEYVYELFPQVQWHLSEHLAVRLGYRTLGWKVESDDQNELDIRLAGLILGLGGIF